MLLWNWCTYLHPRTSDNHMHCPIPCPADQADVPAGKCVGGILWVIANDIPIKHNHIFAPRIMRSIHILVTNAGSCNEDCGDFSGPCTPVRAYATRWHCKLSKTFVSGSISTCDTNVTICIVLNTMITVFTSQSPSIFLKVTPKKPVLSCSMRWLNAEVTNAPCMTHGVSLSMGWNPSPFYE